MHIAMLTPFLLGSIISGTPSAKLAVMPLASQHLDSALVKLLEEVLLDEAQASGQYQVIGASDIQAMLGLERMKDALACDETSCVAEIGGALGVDRLLAARVGVLGDELVISGKLVDISKTEVLGRTTVTVDNKEKYYHDAIIKFTRKLLGDSTASQTITMELFLDKGLDPDDFDDFSQSGQAYRVWAAQRNEESWLLEITKWGTTAMVPMGLAIGLGMASDSDTRSAGLGLGIGMAVFYGLMAGGLWYFDYLNYDSVPDQL